MGAGLLLALMGSASACEELEPLVQRMEEQVLALQPEQALGSLERFETALACSPVPEPELLARAWIAAGLATGFQGGDPGPWFAAAQATEPGFWSPAFPDSMRPESLPVSGRAELDLDLVPEGAEVWLDAARFEPPGGLGAGLHLVQVAETGEPVLYSRRVLLAEGETLSLSTGLEPRAAEPEEPLVQAVEPATLPGEQVPLEREPLVNRPLAGAALAGAAVSGAGLVVALRQNEAMRSAETRHQLEDAYGRQKAAAVTCYVGAGASALLLGASFVF